MKVNKESPSHYRLLFATSTRDGGFISLLPDFQFRHSQPHKAKHTPTDPLTKNCCTPLEVLQHKQSSPISTIPGNRHCHLSCGKAAASGFILKPNQDLPHLMSLGSATLPFSHLGDVSFSLEELLQAQPAGSPSFAGRERKTDPFLGLCVGLKQYSQLPTGKSGPGMHPQHIHVPSVLSLE